ncbi:PTS fructose transporter subunit IIC [Tumebacillus permanentifrigoris]|uniref:PTS system D-fructose-specific IIB component (F1P-forming) (Frc family) /PTS system D-fructose-specific IIC component (F1P-forming) (Frc family) n=1 Tax=Tumebacillus permanentifrigoris TaxID=378543 RepID=A0A316D697_9BACL|nr:fructose-specific PTS transporter subunit EIIC [Tumebacillus permanentifrigoris]PWK06654.1 PTS system D-fructose-specific IIB component (F1P-forming) (Frc family) /PTS system D-fructose-specific IIC component (F1P-forming) (Frc family) [Tumebacillus permanentifrigoris]
MEKKILAVTACPTGIAHTYMAAEALQQAAIANNIALKVETRGAMGIENEFTDEEIAAAHAIIVAAEIDIDAGRFEGKSVLTVPIGEAIKNPKGLLDEALAMTAAQPDANQADVKKPARVAQRRGPYKHLMNGVSHMLPLVVAGGLIIALSFIFGINAFKEEGTLPAALMNIGGGAALALMVPILAGFIAFSIAEKPGLAPGLVGGMLAAQNGAGFLGGIIAGFLAGYVAKWLRDTIKLPKNFEGLKPILIIPFLSTLITGLLMVYVVGTPIKAVMDALTAWLTTMNSANAIWLGLLLGAMMALDMGGPFNKAAYTFAVGLLGSNVFGPMAAVMAAGMVPPLAVALATVIAKKKFTSEEREAGKVAAVLGISFISEGAIPFAAADPFRVIPSMMVGAGVTGALSMLFGCTLRAPHGGIFVMPIPNAVGHPLLYALSIIIGTVVAALLLSVLKKNKATA